MSACKGSLIDETNKDLRNQFNEQLYKDHMSFTNIKTVRDLQDFFILFEKLIENGNNIGKKKVNVSGEFSDDMFEELLKLLNQYYNLSKLESIRIISTTDYIIKKYVEKLIKPHWETYAHENCLEDGNWIDIFFNRPSKKDENYKDENYKDEDYKDNYKDGNNYESEEYETPLFGKKRMKNSCKKRSTKKMYKNRSTKKRCKKRSTKKRPF